MPSLPRPDASAATRRRSPRRPRSSSLGDLMLDVVLAPDRAARDRHGRPRPGALVQGGSAATTARWLGRLGARSSLDLRGRARRRRPGARRRAARGRRRRPGSCGSPARGPGGSACSSRPTASGRSWPIAAPPTRSPRTTCEAVWFAGRDAVHLPVYSLLGEPLGLAGRRAVDAGPRGRGAGQRRPRLDRAAAAARSPGGPRAHRRGRARTCCSRRPPRPRRCSAAIDPRACSSSRRWPSSSAGSKGATVLAREGDEQLALRGRDRAPDGGRHDRRRRRLRRRVPRRLVRGRAAGRSLPASLQRPRSPAIAPRRGS